MPKILLLLCGLLACTNEKTEPSENADDSAAPARRMPAEWEPQAAVWMQWPQRWEKSDEPDFARMVAAILRHEEVVVLVHDADTRASAEAALVEVGGLDPSVIAAGQSAEGHALRFETVPNDSAWMRDNGPRYVYVDGALHAQDWGFDGWGGAFGDIPYAADDAVPAAVAALEGLPMETVELVHERGDLEVNGVDTVVLNWSVIGDPNRNPGLTPEAAEAAMRRHLGVSRVVMLEGAPSGDRTGGHTDGFVRFLDEERVVVGDCSASSACQPGDADDAIYDDAALRLEAAGLTVLRWPYATSVRYRGVNLDTNYLNWLVGNGFVIATGFGDPDADAAAQAQLEDWFPGRTVYVIEMLESWYNGGGVHCHTNDMPLPTEGD